MRVCVSLIVFALPNFTHKNSKCEYLNNECWAIEPISNDHVHAAWVGRQNSNSLNLIGSKEARQAICDVPSARGTNIFNWLNITIEDEFEKKLLLTPIFYTVSLHSTLSPVTLRQLWQWVRLFDLIEWYHSSFVQLVWNGKKFHESTTKNTWIKEMSSKKKYQTTKQHATKNKYKYFSVSLPSTR